MALHRLILIEGLSRLGWPGLAGTVLLVAGLVAGAAWVWPTAQERNQEQARRVQAAARLARLTPDANGHLHVEPTAEQRRAAFYQALPSEANISASIGQIYAAAAAERLSLERGAYTLAPVPRTRLVRYQIVLPVQADYGRIRRFLVAAQAQVPGLHLDDLGLQRQQIGEAAVEAKLQLSLYLVRS